MTFSETELRRLLQERRVELDALLDRIHRNIKRGLDRDSKERAKELEDQDVVDTLGNDALGERLMIDATLDRLDAGLYGTCVSCSEEIAAARLEAYPYALRCVECASDEELKLRLRA